MKNCILSLDMSEVGVCSITMPTFIAELLKDVELGSVVTPASGTLFMMNEISPLLDEIRRKRFHSKVAQLLYLGKRIRMDILTAVAFLKTRVTKATEEDGGKVLRKYARDRSSIGWSAENNSRSDHTSSDGNQEFHGGTRLLRWCYQSVAG